MSGEIGPPPAPPAAGSPGAPVPRAWRRLPGDLAAAMRPGLPGTVRAVAEAVTRASPVYASSGEPKLARDVRTAVRVALERFLDLAGTDQPALPPAVREDFVALGAAEAREDRGPETLLAGYRAAQRLLLRRACEALAGARPVRTEELLDLSEAISSYVDELAAASTDGFTRQLREQVGEGDRRRERLARLLLRGGATPAVAAEAAADAGWPALDWVVPVLLPPDQAREARFRFAPDGVVSERARDAVLLLPAGNRTGRAAVTESLGGRGAVVGPALRWPQAPESVRLAELVRELVGGLSRGDAGAPPVFTDDHLATLALRGESAALAVLSTRRLAPLAGMSPAQRERLQATLRSWLWHWGSRAAVSAELFVHPQTVSYRLRRLRELFGDDLDDPAARFELALVLAARAT